MKLVKNILICGHPDHVDLKLLEHAADIANYNEANVKVVHIITDYPKDTKKWWNVRNPEKLRNSVIREREDFLDGIVESLQKLGVNNVSRELHWGEPAIEVVKEVLHDNGYLVMVVSKHNGKVSYGTRGYPSMDLLRQCPCPIWVTQKKVKKRVRRIVACLGGSGGDVKIEDTNAKILEHAVAIADAEGSEVHVIHVMPLYGGKGVRKRNRKQLKSDLVAYLDDVRTIIKTRCDGFLQQHNKSLSDRQIHLLVGSYQEVVPDFIATHGADLLVMATAARTGIPGLVVGNAAEKMLPQINCPVLVVKSDAFAAQFKREQEMKSSAA